MATESPLIHDGSQTTAAVDLSANQFYIVKITAARQVNLTAAVGDVAYGILQNKPTLGQAADVGILGVTKAVAGAAISAAARLTSDTSGRVITAASTNQRLGVALEAATAAGQLITIALVPQGAAA
jgi:hypothetical protein